MNAAKVKLRAPRYQLFGWPASVPISPGCRYIGTYKSEDLAHLALLQYANDYPEFRYEVRLHPDDSYLVVAIEMMDHLHALVSAVAELPMHKLHNQGDPATNQLIEEYSAARKVLAKHKADIERSTGIDAQAQLISAARDALALLQDPDAEPEEATEVQDLLAAALAKVDAS